MLVVSLTKADFGGVAQRCSCCISPQGEWQLRLVVDSEARVRRVLEEAQRDARMTVGGLAVEAAAEKAAQRGRLWMAEWTLQVPFVL